MPFLHYVNPQVRILPMVLGPSRYEELEPLAALLARILTQGPRAPLIVISSDMNHFAADEQNRRLDRMALEALFSGDAQRLHQTCVSNQISMCGLQPAEALLLALAKTGAPPKFELVGYATSTRVTNNPDRVVGYAGVIIE